MPSRLAWVPGLVTVAALLSAAALLAASPRYFVSDSLKGALSSNNAPSQGMFHSGKCNRTYVVYMSDEFMANITYYDHDTGCWAEPVQVDDLRYRDGHNAPELLITRDGYLHLFYGCHYDPIKYARSLRPEDITRWRLGREIGTGEPYPTPLQLDNDDILLFHRHDLPGDHKVLQFHRSSDNGRSWQASPILVDFGERTWCYIRRVTYDARENRIYLELTMRLRKPKPEELPASATLYEGDYFVKYAVAYDLSSGHLIAMNGADLGTMATREELDANGPQSSEYTFVQLPGSRVLKIQPPATAQPYMRSSDGVHIEGYGVRDGNLKVWKSSDAAHTWSSGRIIVSAEQPEHPIEPSVNIVRNYSGSGPLVLYQGPGGEPSPEFLARYELQKEYGVNMAGGGSHKWSKRWPIELPLDRKPRWSHASHYDIPARKAKGIYALDADHQFVTNRGNETH